jgi:hypothetical protein
MALPLAVRAEGPAQRKTYEQKQNVKYLAQEQIAILDSVGAGGIPANIHHGVSE